VARCCSNALPDGPKERERERPSAVYSTVGNGSALPLGHWGHISAPVTHQAVNKCELLSGSTNQTAVSIRSEVIPGLRVCPSRSLSCTITSLRQGCILARVNDILNSLQKKRKMFLRHPLSCPWFSSVPKYAHLRRNVCLRSVSGPLCYRQIKAMKGRSPLAGQYCELIQ